MRTETLALVRAKILRGLINRISLRCEERQEGDLRIISRAELVGIAVVDDPQYEQSLVSASHLEGKSPHGVGRTLRGNIPSEKSARMSMFAR